MSENMKIVVGGTAEDDAAAFLDAVERADRGEHVHERMLSFQGWEGLASVMTRGRYRLLRHLHAHPEPSVDALVRALGRQYRQVVKDVTVLESAGLVARNEGSVRTTAGTIQAEVWL